MPCLKGRHNHHRKTRGWTCRLTFVTEAGDLVRVCNEDFGGIKVLLKQQGLAAEYLKGSGDVAAMVRIAHALRLGMCSSIPEPA